MTSVKICGIRRVEDARAASEAGADFLGFIFVPGMRRYVAPERASEIITAVRDRSDVRAVGVFVNAPVDEMNRVARLAGLDYVQLSGDEPDEIIEALAVPAIQVIHVRGDVPSERLANRAVATPADLVMLDGASAGAYGGTGRPFDWERVPALGRKFLLAGGLHAGNVSAALERIQPWGVDVSSGVEINGEKDRGRIQEFIRVVKGQ